MMLTVVVPNSVMITLSVSSKLLSPTRITRQMTIKSHWDTTIITQYPVCLRSWLVSLYRSVGGSIFSDKSGSLRIGEFGGVRSKKTGSLGRDEFVAACFCSALEKKPSASPWLFISFSILQLCKEFVSQTIGYGLIFPIRFHGLPPWCIFSSVPNTE